MASTTFVNNATPIVADWLNDVDAVVYEAASSISGASTRTALSKFADRVSLKDFGAVGDGVTNDTSAVQAAFTAALSGNFDLDGGGYTYKCNSSLTWQRSSAGHSSRLRLSNATFDFSGMGTSGSAFTIGASSSTYFLEQGQIVLRNVTLLGPESSSLDPRTDAPGGSTVGLDLQFAGGVTLENVCAFGFYNNAHSLFSFPVKAVNCNFRRAWIGLHLDEASNDQVWDCLTLPNCRYPILIRAVSTSLDSGKINNVTFNNPWMEGSSVGPVIDSSTGGGGAERFRSIYFNNPYCALITYDHFRMGTAWTLATPGTRGSNCSEFISDVRIEGGLFNPTGGLYSATQALVAFDSATRVRDVYINTATLDDDTDSDVFVNAPAGGLYISRGYPGISNGGIRISLWDINGAVVRRLAKNGGVFVGTKVTPATVSEIGVELDPLGVLYLTRDGSQTFDFNRLNSDGTIGQFRRGGTSVGSISVTTTATAFNTSSDYRLKQNVTPADQAKAVQAVLSWPLREFAFKATPDVRQFGFLAHELQAVKPEAVTGEKDGAEMQSVDYSKLVPELVAAVQYLLQKNKD